MNRQEPDTSARPATAAEVSLGEGIRVWTRVAALSFGGPAGQIAVMHRILVEEKKWIDEPQFLHALNFCMLLPGPEAQQLAVYNGWLMHGTKGGLIAGTLFVLPGFLAILALSLAYVAFGQTALVEGLFFGLQAAVLAIVLQAVAKIGRRALKGPVFVAIAGLAFAGIFVFGVPFPLIVLGAGCLGLVLSRAGIESFRADADARTSEAPPPRSRHGDAAATRRAAAVAAGLWLIPVIGLLGWLGPNHVFTEIAVFFSKMAVVTFGGAYAVLAYVAQEAVQNYGWLNPEEMLHALAMAETTPGPLIQLVQFIGFMAAYRTPGPLDPYAAATLAAVLTTWVTFAPCFLWIFLGAPFVETLRRNHAVAGALRAITAAVVGVILNLAIWFGLHVLFGELKPLSPRLAVDIPVLDSLDPYAAGLSALAAAAVLLSRVPLALILGMTAAAGIAIRLGAQT